MAAEAERIVVDERGCGRCSVVMEAVELRSGALVWRCPACRRLEI